MPLTVYGICGRRNGCSPRGDGTLIESASSQISGYDRAPEPPIRPPAVACSPDTECCRALAHRISTCPNCVNGWLPIPKPTRLCWNWSRGAVTGSGRRILFSSIWKRNGR